jgi:hypothetical protein
MENTARKNPFIAGNWVRGERFFGRKALIEEILATERHAIWVAGTRRFGKTSLLKQIEYATTRASEQQAYLPLLWDLQGSRDLAGLKESLLEAVEEASGRFAALGISDIAQLEMLDLFAILRELKRKVNAAGKTFLLLCDEAEELLNVDANTPEALPKLRRFFQRGESLRVVICATPGLARLNESAHPETSPFLHGFVPPLYLTPMEEESARQLIALGDFSETESREISQKTNNHPYLIQLICARLFESRDLVKVIQEVCSDRMISDFFAVDFQNLQKAEAAILSFLIESEADIKQIAEQVKEDETTTGRFLFELTQLGLVREVDHRYTLSNYFFRQWLAREQNRKIDVAGQAGRPESGQSVGHYEILTLLGSGGMGAVYKVHDPMLQRTVALKVLLPEYNLDPEFRQRFFAEARAASALNHPNIETIYQIGESAKRLFIAMECVEGSTLSEWHAEHQDDFELMLHISLQLAGGLAHAHAHGVVHRDFKPDNVMITAENTAKILDFGLAKLLKKSHTTLTKPGEAIGTPAYMSPEQANGLPADARTDIFSFGIVLYELFTGRLPFAGQYQFSVLYAILNDAPLPIEPATLPESFRKLLFKALEKDPDSRYQSMQDLLTDLQKTHFR